MSKGKIQKFAEVATFSNVFQLPYLFNSGDYEKKGKWRETYFGNSNPIVLELGCGRGEYTVGLAEKFPKKNFIGIDIKGARIWKGAKTALERKLHNAAFVRTRIDHIEKIFAPGETDEIWLTFPDPQPQKTRERKRLTSPMFLNRYRNILKKDGTVNLKTDNFALFEYSKKIAEEQSCEILYATDDLYADIEKVKTDFVIQNVELFQIKTYYEAMFTQQGFKICLLSFRLS